MHGSINRRIPLSWLMQHRQNDVCHQHELNMPRRCEMFPLEEVKTVKRDCGIFAALQGIAPLQPRPVSVFLSIKCSALLPGSLISYQIKHRKPNFQICVVQKLITSSLFCTDRKSTSALLNKLARRSKLNVDAWT